MAAGRADARCPDPSLLQVDLEVVWQAATRDMPELQRLLSAMLDEVRQEEAEPGDASQTGDGQ